MAVEQIVGGVPWAAARVKAFLDHDGNTVPVVAPSAVNEQCLAFFRFLDKNGDGTGGKDANEDYSITPDIFFIQPAAGKVFQISRMIVTMRDTNMQWGQYGGLAALTNGVQVRVQDDSSTLIDITDGEKVKSNGAWGSRCFDAEISAPAAGDTFFHCRWTFALSGQFIRLEGDANERLEVVLNDNFTGLISHAFQVHGYDETVKT